MPSGVYERTDIHRMNISKAGKGKVPHNKGVKTEKIKKKIELFNLGLPIECKNHGKHLNWRLHSYNNVQCRLCGADWQRTMKKRDPLKFVLKDARQHAKGRDRGFNLTLEDLRDVLEGQNNKCVFTGLEFNDENIISLDRIDSTKGYEKDNVQLVTIRANKMKSDMTDKEFINYCKLIAEHNKEINHGRKVDSESN